MNFLQLNKLSAWAVILTMILGIMIWQSFDDQETRLGMEQYQSIKTLQSTWPQEDAARARTARQQVLEMERAQADALVKALGGPLSAAVKNPGLDIRQMLTQIALACAPTDAVVSVTVDRFTEFDVAVTLNEPVEARDLAGLAQCLLKNGTTYVHSLRFIQGYGVKGRLDAAAIGSVTNWNDVSAESVAALLRAGTAPE